MSNFFSFCFPATFVWNARNQWWCWPCFPHNHLVKVCFVNIFVAQCCMKHLVFPSDRNISQLSSSGRETITCKPVISRFNQIIEISFKQSKWKTLSVTDVDKKLTLAARAMKWQSVLQKLRPKRKKILYVSLHDLFLFSLTQYLKVYDKNYQLNFKRDKFFWGKKDKIVLDFHTEARTTQDVKLARLQVRCHLLILMGFLIFLQ